MFEDLLLSHQDWRKDMAMHSEKDIRQQLHLDEFAKIYPRPEPGMIDPLFVVDGVYYSSDAMAAALNALDASLLQAFLEYCDQIACYPGIRGYVLSGYLNTRDIVHILFPRTK